MSEELSDIDKLKVLFDYWISHGKEHLAENERWLERVKGLGLSRVAEELEAVVRLSEETNAHIESARGHLEEASPSVEGSHSEEGPPPLGGGEKDLKENEEEDRIPHRHIELHPIGVLRTPYKDHAPRQPQPDAEGDFRVVLDERWADGLYMLEKFKYLNVLFYLDRSPNDVVTRVTPPSVPMKVGLFASRSPKRPNPIALSVVTIKKISGNTIFISGIDALDKTPLLDIKPYIGAVDCKPDAGNGWIDELLDSDHHISHLKGESHNH
ncbi:MAG TPA: tRNA (N6-threonylcarbamoyladenosine(37)-N6)-methyltransferase TrmO [Spirochaetota bacterium]|nr:tRNA (N6-threonylcarbamoyladenosine(37)-N6)-methyltransferase TrmO [Spirochaetota bacterium]